MPQSGFPIPMAKQMEGGPVPATSKRQFRFMQAVAHGGLKKPGLSSAKAKEFVSGQSSKGLPEKTRRHKVKFPSTRKPK
jgi:hypothetical protein